MEANTGDYIRSAETEEGYKLISLGANMYYAEESDLLVYTNSGSLPWGRGYLWILEASTLKTK